jgi:hypothetical protein
MAWEDLWASLPPEQQEAVRRLLGRVADLVASSPRHVGTAVRAAIRLARGQDHGDIRAIVAARIGQDRGRSHGGESDRVRPEHRAKHRRARPLGRADLAGAPVARGVFVPRAGRDPAGDTDIVAPWDRFLLLAASPNPVVIVGLEGRRTSMPRLVVAGLDHRLAELLLDVAPKIGAGGVELSPDVSTIIDGLSRDDGFRGPEVDTALPRGVWWRRCERLRDVALRLFRLGQTTFFARVAGVRDRLRLPPVGPGHCPYCRLPLGGLPGGLPRRYLPGGTHPWPETVCWACSQREAAWTVRPHRGGREGLWVICPKLAVRGRRSTCRPPCR